MTIPGGIRVKLSLALLVIVGSALLAAYAIIVPSLERRLVEAKLDQQEADAQILAIDFATRVAQNNLSLGDFVDERGFRRELAGRRLRCRRHSGEADAAVARRLRHGRRLRDGVGPDGARVPRRASAPSAPASGTTGASTPRSPCRCSPAAT